MKHLRRLPATDQRIYLLGRITTEATRMDAALRMFHAALRGERELDALLDAPDVFRQNVKACRKLLEQHPELETDTQEALSRTLDRAEAPYTQRNRYIHDLLRSGLLDRS